MIQNQNNYISKSGEALASTSMDSQDHLRKMFIGGLAAVTTEDTLRQFFGQWGEVVDAVVMRDPTTKRSRGFGFITYSDSSMVDKAQNSRPHIIDGKAVDSKRALPRPEGGKNDASSNVKKIFVGGLKENHDEQALQEHFSQFGNVVSVKILSDKTTGRKRGFAFIEFDDYDAVDKAVLYKNHTIKYVLVDVKKSVYKQELAKKMATQQRNGMLMPGAPGAQVPPVAQPGIPGPYQQPMAAYGPQAAAYGYPQSVAPGPAAGAGAYNGWGGYVPNYQQQIAPGYGSYGNTQHNGAAAWNATAYSPAPASWQNGYGPAAASSSLTPAQPAAAANSWNNGTAAAAPGVQQAFGDYQQSYNGGPQKAGTLQTNRMNPYQVASPTNYVFQQQ